MYPSLPYLPLQLPRVARSIVVPVFWDTGYTAGGKGGYSDDDTAIGSPRVDDREDNEAARAVVVVVVRRLLNWRHPTP